MCQLPCGMPQRSQLVYWHIGILAHYLAYYPNCFSAMLKALSCNECKFVSVRREALLISKYSLLKED